MRRGVERCPLYPRCWSAKVEGPGWQALFEEHAATRGASDSQRADLLAQLGRVDPARVAPHLGRYTNPALGELTLTLQNGRLIFDAGEVHSELRPRRDPADAVTGYRLVDAPLAFPQQVAVAIEDDAGGWPRVVLTVLAGYADAEADVAYPFAPVGTAATSTPQPLRSRIDRRERVGWLRRGARRPARPH